MSRDTLGTLRARIAELNAELAKISAIAQKFESDAGLTLSDLFTASQFVGLLVDRLGEVRRRAEVAEAALQDIACNTDDPTAETVARKSASCAGSGRGTGAQAVSDAISRESNGIGYGEFDYESELDERDDEFEFDCGMDRNGNCGKAGSEECEFECPFK